MRKQERATLINIIKWRVGVLKWKRELDYTLGEQYADDELLELYRMDKKFKDVGAFAKKSNALKSNLAQYEAILEHYIIDL